MITSFHNPDLNIEPIHIVYNGEGMYSIVLDNVSIFLEEHEFEELKSKINSVSKEFEAKYLVPTKVKKKEKVFCSEEQDEEVPMGDIFDMLKTLNQQTNQTNL